jgi:hypothetical protein
MFSLILWCIAPILNAMMDLVENENFTKSIFYRPPNEDTGNVRWNNFWYKRESWKSAKKLFGYKFDAWHITKSTMIYVCLICSSVIIVITGLTFHTDSLALNIILEIILRVVTWNVLFSLFYHKLFRSKTWQK